MAVTHKLKDMRGLVFGADAPDPPPPISAFSKSRQSAGAETSATNSIKSVFENDRRKVKLLRKRLGVGRLFTLTPARWIFFASPAISSRCE